LLYLRNTESRALYCRSNEIANWLSENAQKKSAIKGDRAKSTPKEEGGGDKIMNVHERSNWLHYSKLFCALQDIFTHQH